jgi:hypothetical protein
MFQMEKFIYRVNTKDEILCHNLAFTKSLFSPSLAHMELYKVEHPAYTLDPEKFITGLFDEEMFLSPRLINVLLTSWEAHGFRMGVGVEETKWFPPEHSARVSRIANFEVELERFRRKIDNALPSRLVSLFLADDSFEGRLMLSEMFPATQDSLLIEIEILHKLRFHRADSQWLTEFISSGESSTLENYWKGIAFNEKPKFEYLLDGAFKLKKSDDAEQFKKILGRWHPLLKHGS